MNKNAICLDETEPSQSQTKEIECQRGTWNEEHRAEEICLREEANRERKPQYCRKADKYEHVQDAISP